MEMRYIFYTFSFKAVHNISLDLQETSHMNDLSLVQNNSVILLKVEAATRCKSLSFMFEFFSVFANWPAK